MKKINSISYGGAVIAAGISFAAVIPALLYCVSSAFDMKSSFSLLIKISIIIGVLILLFFSVLLAIEMKQDKRINKFYRETRNSKIELPDKTFECQNCGNRQVGMEDTYCKVCGIRFNK